LAANAAGGQGPVTIKEYSGQRWRAFWQAHIKGPGSPIGTK
jgi:hypothetical protein